MLHPRLHGITLLRVIVSALFVCNCHSVKPVAIVTGGTRGIGSGIASALADAGYDLLLTYNTNETAATDFASSLVGCNVECVGGDISLSCTRDKIFECLDSKFANQPLKAMIHNAGQYVGVTADNSDNLKAEKPLLFGDASLVRDDGTVNFDTLRYYQRMYGEAFIDLCERSIVRMREGGSLVGVSSPGGTAFYYKTGPAYSMPGSGKCLMEFSMRIYALQAAARNINVNLVVPGITRTDSWTKLAEQIGQTLDDVMARTATRVPMKKVLLPRDIGDVVAFLCSTAGRYVTGTVLPIDGGLHLNPPE
jgi:NAD(P)-dependent dehydrogenase (short-subunit alcohol dehydrogenase family)